LILEAMQFVQHNWILVLVALASGGMLLWPYIQKLTGGAHEVSTLEATRLMNGNALLLDVREAKQFEGGKLPNAMHIPLSELKARGGELTKFTKRPVVVYCSRGVSSRGAESILKQAGFAEVYQLQGGMEAWRSAGLPVERTA
jgi:rhodanese-related sulfurtransferase